MRAQAAPTGVWFSHDTLRLHLARLELQGMLVKANSECASKLPQNPGKGTNTISTIIGTSQRATSDNHNQDS
jgi:hypothetical protein